MACQRCGYVGEVQAACSRNGAAHKLWATVDTTPGLFVSRDIAKRQAERARFHWLAARGLAMEPAIETRAVTRFYRCSDCAFDAVEGGA